MMRISDQCSVSTKVTASAPAFLMSESPAMALLSSLGVEEADRYAPYVAEAGQFQGAGFPTVICGPGSIDQAHKPNEFIDLNQINEGEAFRRRLIAHLSNA